MWPMLLRLLTSENPGETVKKQLEVTFELHNVIIIIIMYITNYVGLQTRCVARSKSSHTSCPLPKKFYEGILIITRSNHANAFACCYHINSSHE